MLNPKRRIDIRLCIHWLFCILFLLISFVAAAQSEEHKEPAWYEVVGTFAGVIATIVGIALTFTKLRIASPNKEKVNLEIEMLKLELAEKREKLGKTHTEDSRPEFRNQVQDEHHYSTIGAQQFTRLTVGLLALLLPIILVVGTFVLGELSILPSISSYYYTRIGDVYVGFHIAMAVALFSYFGYQRTDYITTKIQGIFCVVIALFPTQSNAVVNLIHICSLTFFFLLQSYISMFLFTRAASSSFTKNKRIRNNIFRVCGIVIILCLVLATISSLFLRSSYIDQYHPILYLESIAYFAFGLSWLVKGQYMFRDIRTNI